MLKCMYWLCGGYWVMGKHQKHWCVVLCLQGRERSKSPTTRRSYLAQRPRSRSRSYERSHSPLFPERDSKLFSQYRNWWFHWCLSQNCNVIKNFNTCNNCLLYCFCINLNSFLICFVSYIFILFAISVAWYREHSSWTVPVDCEHLLI